MQGLFFTIPVFYIGMKERLLNNYPDLSEIISEIDAAIELIFSAYKLGGKMLLCGNGGSCSDCGHITGELMKEFMIKRDIDSDVKDNLKRLYGDDAEYMINNLQGALPAISLPAQTEIISAYANDVAADMVYAQLVYGYGTTNDVLIAISTSGNSKNVVNAARVAKARGMKIVAMTGSKKCLLDDISDVSIKINESETFRIQEYHLPVYHYICAELEKRFFYK